MRKIISLFLSILYITAIAQDDSAFMTGLLPDNGTYNTLPEKAELITRDYKTLPESYSLKQYAPSVRSQSQFGTCTSWATVYAARTIAEAIRNNWTDQRIITSEAFSPIYVYAQIKNTSDDNCKRGSHIFHALDLLKNQGVVKLNDFDNLCANPTEITNALKQKATLYKIDDYFTLFKLDKISSDSKVKKVKKAIAEKCPVIIAMWLPKSFHSAGGDWSGIDVNPNDHGYHAMCVVGYDDNRLGGAFEIMNSWGQNWGDRGYTWVKYDDFGKYVDQAYEMFVSTGRNDEYGDNISYNKQLAGSISLRLSNGEEMPVTYNSVIGSYRLNNSYISGTRYRVYITNNEPAYVYIIGSDLSNTPTTIFPQSPQISPALTYKSNSIAIPDERYYIEMDGNSGTDYMCVIYSSEPLDVESVRSKIKNSAGSFVQKVHSALGTKMIPYTDTKFSKYGISFDATTHGLGVLVPVIVEIPHR